MSPREIPWFGALLFVAVCAGSCWLAACTLFGSSESQIAIQTAADIARCQAEGRDAGSYGVYDKCMADAGLR